MKDQRIDFKLIIAESWQKSRNNWFLWGSSFGWFAANALLLQITSWMASHKLDPSNQAMLGLYCLVVFAGIILLFLPFFFLYTLPFGAGTAALGGQAHLKDAWTTLKSHFLRWVLLELITLLYLGFLLLLALLVVRFSRPLLTGIFWRTIITWGCLLLFGAPVMLAPFGFLFQGMGVWQSFRSGLRVFSTARFTFVLLSFWGFLITFLIIGIMAIFTLLISRQTITYEAYVSLGKSTGFLMLNKTVYAVIYPIYYTAFAIGYFKISPKIVRSKS